MEIDVSRFAQTINHVYADAGVACRVVPQPQSILMTPLNLLFKLELGRVRGRKSLITDATQGRVVKELNERLGGLLREHWGPSGHLELVSFTEQPFSLSLPYPGDAGRRVWAPSYVQPQRVPVGLHYTWQGEHLSYWDLRDSPHVLVAGITGSGKSVMLSTILLSLCRMYRAEQMELVTVDLKRRSLPVFDEMPHVRAACVWDLNQARARLAALDREIDRRIAERVSSPVLVFAVDELADLLEEDKEAQRLYFRAARAGRELGVHLVAGIQKPLVSIMGSGKSQMLQRVIGRMRDAQDSRNAAGFALPAHLLSTPGAMYNVGTGVELVQGFYTDAAIIREYAGRYRQLSDVGDAASLLAEPERPALTYAELAEVLHPPASVASRYYQTYHGFPPDTSEDLLAIKGLVAHFGPLWDQQSTRQLVLALGYSDGGNSYKAGKAQVAHLKELYASVRPSVQSDARGAQADIVVVDDVVTESEGPEGRTNGRAFEYLSKL